MAGLVRMLETHGHEVIYWVGGDRRVEQEFPEIIFHDYLDAIAGVPSPRIDAAAFAPASTKLLKQLYRVESLTQTMINSAPLRAMSALERRHTYYEMVGYWHGLLEKYRPDFVLFTIVPHSIYNYLIYELAKLLGIKTLMFENTIVSDRDLMYRDFWEGSVSLQMKMKELDGQNFRLTDLSQDIQIYYNAYQQKRVRSSPHYVNYMSYFGPRKKSRLKIISKAWRNRQLWKTVKVAIQKRFGSRNSRRDYHKLQTKPNWHRKFIYVPLNFQPERSTSPQGDIFYDQILMLQILAASLPPDWVIYVKEHPNQWQVGGIFYSEARYKGYYQKIANLPNVFLVPVDTDNYLLLDKSQAVAVVTGTPGWEAVLWSKPAMIFGYPWYRDFPGLLRVTDVESCRKAFQKIVDGYQIEEQQVLNYLKAVDEISYRFFVDDFDYRPSELTREESLKNFEDAVLQEVQNYS